MRSLSILFALALATAACDRGGSPVAPSPAWAPVPTSVTFTVRSGAEGLPVVSGASIHLVGATPRTTDSQGRAVIDNVPMPVTYAYAVDALGFLSYRGLVRSSTEVVTLWPLEPGVTGPWISATSYLGYDYDNTLWRPDRDVRLELQGVLANEPYRSVWDHAVRQVASAIESSGSGVPTIRLDAGAGAVPVRLEERPKCEAVKWWLAPGVFTPPSVMSISAETRARDPEAVLDIVAGLVGFGLSSGRHSARHAGGSLSPIERTAIRMRMLRPPGTYFDGRSLEDATNNAAEGASAYWCR